MSLTRIGITNFQSLQRLNLELGHFTVIVGASSSGKSALIRAFKALTSNVRGTSVITRGQKAMAITVWTETHVITLERTERSGAYRISDNEGSNLTFTKLAGEVPDQVTRALRIDPVAEGGSVNFASQFDKPYLLDESGATVARILGELTNVNAIFEAVRSANRIRTQAASGLKTRRSDLDQVKSHLGQFQGLSDRLKALDEAEQLDARRKELDARIGRLDTALRTLRIAQRAIAKAAVPEVPGPDQLNEVLNEFLDLRSSLNAVAAKQKYLRQLNQGVEHLTRQAEDVEMELAALIKDAGVCPTCGQKVH